MLSVLRGTEREEEGENCRQLAFFFRAAYVINFSTSVCPGCVKIFKSTTFSPKEAFAPPIKNRIEWIVLSHSISDL
jgi:hypothetical protein